MGYLHFFSLTTSNGISRLRESKSNSILNQNRRKLVSYQSSSWELLWIENVDKWANDKDICRVLLEEQADMIHDFLALTCTSRMPAPYQNWCVQDDNYSPMWYNMWNRSAFDIYWEHPAHIPANVEIPPPTPVVPTALDEHIVSRFVFMDETTGQTHIEYIEPLVSHLRFPLSGCFPTPSSPSFQPVVFRGYIIPPPPAAVSGVKKYYFDAGASNWNSGMGGPSLSYFHHMWARHSIEFDEIYAYEMTTDVSDFEVSVPDFAKNRTHFQKCAVASNRAGHTGDSPFIPLLIKELAPPGSFVFFKLDIDSPLVENGQIEFILDDPSNTIAELAYEHHILGNYLMYPYWIQASAFDNTSTTIRESYELFLRLRKKGIRAHSWI